MTVPVGLQTRIPWHLCLELLPGPCCPPSPTSIQRHTPTAPSLHPTTSFLRTPMVEAVPAASTVRGAGAAGRQEAMGGLGAQAGLRNGPLSPSPAVAVSQNSPAGEAAFGGVGSLVGLVMAALLHPGARQALLLISELFPGSIPMEPHLAWLSPITP